MPKIFKYDNGVYEAVIQKIWGNYKVINTFDSEKDVALLVENSSVYSKEKHISSQKAVFKMYEASRTYADVEYQQKMMSHLNDSKSRTITNTAMFGINEYFSDCLFVMKYDAASKNLTIISNKTDAMKALESNANENMDENKFHIIQLHTYTEGTVLGEIPQKSSEMLQKIGEAIGNMHQNLNNFPVKYDCNMFSNNPFVLKNSISLINILRNYVCKEKHCFDIKVFQNEKYLKNIISDEFLIQKIQEKCSHISRANIFDYFFKKVKTELSVLDENFFADYESKEKIKKGMTHGDLNDNNLILIERNIQLNVNECPEFETCIGIIDYGDCNYSILVNDIVTACTYSMFGLSEPIEVVCNLVAGYVRKHPLSLEEIKMIYPLILLRLLTSIANNSYLTSQDPENEYLNISQNCVWFYLSYFYSFEKYFDNRMEIALQCAANYPTCLISESKKNPNSQFASAFSIDLRFNVLGIENDLFGIFASNSVLCKNITMPKKNSSQSSTCCVDCSQSASAIIIPYMSVLPPLCSQSPKPILTNSAMRNNFERISVRTRSLRTIVFPTSICTTDSSVRICTREQKQFNPNHVYPILSPDFCKTSIENIRVYDETISQFVQSEKSLYDYSDAENIICEVEMRVLCEQDGVYKGTDTVIQLSGISLESLIENRTLSKFEEFKKRKSSENYRNMEYTNCVIFENSIIGDMCLRTWMIEEKEKDINVNNIKLYPHLEFCIKNIHNDTFSRAVSPIDNYVSKCEQILYPNPSNFALNMISLWDPNATSKITIKKCTCNSGVNLPNELLQLSKEEILSKRNEYFGQNLTLAYRNNSPLQALCGYGTYIYDENGVNHLDCVNNVTHIGHSNTYVSNYVSTQINLINTNSRYLYPQGLLLMEELKTILPNKLNKIYLLNSGSEANELALRMARIHSNSNHKNNNNHYSDNFICMNVAYHGHTNLLIDVSPYKNLREGGEGMKKNILRLPIPDTLFGRYKNDNDIIISDNEMKDMYSKYADDAVLLIEKYAKENNNIINGYIHESVLSCGGVHFLNDIYLQKIYKVIKKYNGVIIADEVQTGLGRLGNTYWSFLSPNYNNSEDDKNNITNENDTIILPDIITIGKPLGNGMPIAAVVCNEDIVNSFSNTKMEFFATFGGCPIACVSGLSTVRFVKEFELMNRAKVIGNLLLKKLEKIAKNMKGNIIRIGQIRGRGLIIGMEIIKEINGEIYPAFQEAKLINEKLRTLNVVLSRDGYFENILKMKPPMIWAENEVDMFCSCLEIALNDFSVKKYKSYFPKLVYGRNYIAWDSCE